MSNFQRKPFLFITVLTTLFILTETLYVCHAELQFTVQPSKNWGNISRENIKILLENIAFHFETHIRVEHEMDDSINVYYNPNWTGLNVLSDERHNLGVRTSSNMSEAEWIYYFVWMVSHEICHIMHNYESTTIDNPNLWFQESIAMMSAIWTLKSMAKTWEKKPTYKTVGYP